jgi:lysozyme
MNIEKLTEELIHDEGLKLKPYRCTAGKLTIGVGRNLDDVGLSEKECLYLLSNDIDRNYWDLKELFTGFAGFPQEAQHVLINLRHQLGGSGLRGFKNMVKACEKGDWKKAAIELRDSKLWRKDTPERAERLAKRFEAI